MNGKLVLKVYISPFLIINLLFHYLYLTSSASRIHMCGFLSTITGFLFWRKMYFRVLIYKKRSWVGKSVNGLILIYLIYIVGSSGGSEVKGLSANTRDLGLIPGSRKCPGEGNGNPLQYSCLVNPMVRGAWLATIHVVAKSQTWNNSNNKRSVKTHDIIWSNWFQPSGSFVLFL